MLKDITLGQYYPTESLIHQLDPRVKMLATVIYMVLLFLNDSVIGYVIQGVVLAVVIALTKIPFRQILRGIRMILFLLMFSVLFTLLFTKGEDMLFSFGIINISWQGIILSIKITVRLFMLVTMSTIMTLTTKPTDIADGLEKAFGFLNKIGVPVHEIAMMLTIALRFIPILMEETDKVIRAQKARGADFESGSFIQRAKSLIPIFVPLIVSSVKRAMDLAMAMEARCYRGGEGRTKMIPLRYKRMDVVAYLILAGYVVVCISVKVFFSV